MEVDPTCLEECEYDQCNGRNRHHLYYPRKEYRDRVSKTFRRLGVNVVDICVNKHREIHANEKPPAKPSRDEMLEAISFYNNSTESSPD